MIKLFLSLFLFLISVFYPIKVFAQTNSFVSVVNPVRGLDFWDLKNQKIEDAVYGQIEILKKYNINSTWLIRFDALNTSTVVDLLKSLKDEKGLFLEITPSWTKASKVSYRQSSSWHNAGSAFLSGYDLKEREKLIDSAFANFKSVFGYYPKSVGAWWIDAYSLNYMQQKYQIDAALLVADQYSTDNYQIWGQYWSAPYYPSINNALHPAQNKENKIPVVITQWAVRDPVNGYGKGVEESTFSVQANDYIDYHNLDSSYFEKLVDIYTKQKLNQFGFLVVGLENSYNWNKYKKEYENQIQILSKKQTTDNLSIVTLEEFGRWYKKTFPDISPAQIIVADDPLGSFKKVVWFMNPYFRAGWFINSDGGVFRDIRQYVDGEEELCFKVRCDLVNFATFATRVLDDVTNSNKWVIDIGKISDFKVSKAGDKYVVNYSNEAGKFRQIEFLPKDISVDGKISSIDGSILNVIKQNTTELKKQNSFKESGFDWTVSGVLTKTIKFLFFLIIACIIPGLIFLHNIIDKQTPFFKKIFLSVIAGSVLLTIIFYTTSLLHLRFLSSIYILICLVFFIKLKLFRMLNFKSLKIIDRLGAITILVIFAGTIFQNIPMFKNGLIFSFGMGFWGPNTHDGVWHVSLINQLIKSVPSQNPIFAGEILKNYHFFYDLLIALTAVFTNIPVLDLVFRFFPVLFSVSLGIGTYYLVSQLFLKKHGIIKTKIVALFSLYFVYFAGSFGWIVEYIKQKNLAGESDFWANQSISFNLNPPFAISLLIIITFLLLLDNERLKSIMGVILGALLVSSLAGFKSYGAVLVSGSLIIISLVNIFKKEFSFLYISIISGIISLLIFLLNFSPGQQLFIYSPFWFVHSMIDSADRLGWQRLSLARTVGYESKNWFKFISAEVISLLIFIFGNLGLRFFSLFTLLKTESIVRNDTTFFIFIFTILSFLIPIIFIQSGNPWNTIQFTYYGLYTTAIAAGSMIAYLIFKLPKVFELSFILLIIFLTPINSITTATYYTNFLPHARVDSKELEALEFLSSQKDGTVLTYPYDKKYKTTIAEPWPLFVYDSTSYVSALSKKVVFLEDEGQNQILLTDYKKRLIASKDFFINPINTKFLEENNIKYIYIPKILGINLDESTLGVKNIFENSEMIIYKLPQ